MQLTHVDALGSHTAKELVALRRRLAVKGNERACVLASQIEHLAFARSVEDVFKTAVQVVADLLSVLNQILFADDLDHFPSLQCPNGVALHVTRSVSVFFAKKRKKNTPPSKC